MTKFENENHSQLIGILSKIDPMEQFSDAYSDTFIFIIMNENNFIGYTDVRRLRDKYNNINDFQPTNYKDYKKFLTDIINYKKTIDRSELIDCFIPNDTILSLYKNDSFPNFLEKYTINSMKKNEYIIKNTLSFNSQLTVMYCLYQNEYYSYINEHIGIYYSMKLKDWFVPEKENYEIIFE